MNFISARDFTGARAWGALDVTEIANATIRLHWTDQPYVWHVNDGEEVFVVLDGAVTMRYRTDSVEYAREMRVGDICHALAGEEHVAHPIGEARILVIERKGSI